MLDSRVTDAVRSTERQLELVMKELIEQRESMNYVKKMLRDIVDKVTRKAKNA